jgi:hypothetical protein
MNLTQAAQAPEVANITLAKIAEAIGDEAAAAVVANATGAFAGADKRLAYCSVLLKQRCSEKLSA